MDSLKTLMNPEDTKKRPCSALWHTPIIRANGQVSFCLSDIDVHMEIGNIFENDFLDVWLGHKANQYRLWHAKGKQENIAICSICSYYEAHAIPGSYWDQYEAIMQKEMDRVNAFEKKIHQWVGVSEKTLYIDLRKNNSSGFEIEGFKRVIHELLLQKLPSGPIFESVHVFCDETVSNENLVKLVHFLFKSNWRDKYLFTHLYLNLDDKSFHPGLIDALVQYLYSSKSHIVLQLKRLEISRILLNLKSIWSLRYAGSRALFKPEIWLQSWVSLFFLRLFSRGKIALRYQKKSPVSKSDFLIPVLHLDGFMSLYDPARKKSSERIEIGDSFFKTWFSPRCREIVHELQS